MSDCCESRRCALTAMRETHARVLWVALIINALMFFVETWAGYIGNSTSLMADALDMLGDSLVYGFSLFVLARSPRWQAGAALAKGACMLVFGLGVLGQAAYKAMVPVMPSSDMMGMVGAAALAANLACFAMLYSRRSDNLNMSSTWLCSRNDLFANVAVLGAAGAGYLVQSRWPDIAVGVVIALLFLGSAYGVLRRSVLALRAPGVPRITQLKRPV